jgi:hypothetical protein
MGLGIGSLLGKVFGTEKALEKSIDAVVRAGDALVYTKEEKEAARAALALRAQEVLLDWLKASQGHNVARRFLAIIITATWLSMYIISMLMDTVSPWLTDETMRASLKASSLAVGARANEMNGAMMLILAFYFAAPHMGSIVEAALEKFGGKKKELPSG